MITKIRKDLEPCIEQFVNTLKSEHDKVVSLQNNIDRQEQAMLVTEKNRLEDFKQVKSNLYDQEETFKAYTINLNDKEKVLNNEISKYNAQKSEYEQKVKQIAHDVSEAKTLKDLNFAQLEKNRKIEENYQKKLDFLKEDDNRIEAENRASNARSVKLDAQEKMVNRKEYDNAKIKLDLDERADILKIEEKRLNIERANLGK